MNTTSAGLHQSEVAAGTTDVSRPVELANQLLARHRYGTEEHERGHALLVEAANGVGGAHAKWLLGAYYLQVNSRPDARAQAALWLLEAAKAGIPMAADRLVDLYLRGWGVPRSPEKALKLLEALAAQGYARAAWELGYLRSVGTGSGMDQACVAFARACALGDPFAYYSLGLRFALGAGVGKDPALARALLLRAADADIPDAITAADDLVPDGMCSRQAASWYGRLKANLRAGQELLQQLQPGPFDEEGSLNPRLRDVEKHFSTLGHPAIRLDGSGRLDVTTNGSASLRREDSAWEWLSRHPRVGVNEHFATREECAHLISHIMPRLTDPSEYRRPGDNDAGEVTHFNGSGSPIGALYTDPVVRTLERRIADMTEWSIDAVEPCSIIRYQSGQEYKPHVDYFTEEQILRNVLDRHDYGGQRIATFLLYLRAPDEGGETHYHESGLSVSGRSGMGIIHYNLTHDGRLDHASRHSGRAIVRGEKWVWRSALRANSFDCPNHIQHAGGVE